MRETIMLPETNDQNTIVILKIIIYHKYCNSSFGIGLRDWVKVTVLRLKAALNSRKERNLHPPPEHIMKNQAPHFQTGWSAYLAVSGVVGLLLLLSLFVGAAAAVIQ